ncbi:phosphatidylinositol-3,4,5-trisphosphate 3-phosphatase [Melanomma pulvis-pyrius CBS 109.77]|uniref:phosphatidylinositol-3,4,5-trisphosphate 3-phosphatase n=1 Tax=Melanomma pulvis-pyrius CBS 109.77 TaxID=1314802 RepID=A0A6A6XTD8_9PLEO|nr:phosphatidylinositol-3,4,5-trisphosphate 3-phosphatase [Melanomma pulvis-pyrius CBS 109.77]
MASLLRQIVAGPRARHPEAGLDLCYVTDKIIATSGPSGTYPQRYYRNPLDSLVKFLDSKHGQDWAIWEFRAEGTGYPDSEVYGRVYHYPFPDHHPPPFAIIPHMMASMRNWLHEKEGRVVVVHCKAGKGRSGTASCSYLISEEGWTVDKALKRFTERRMRPNMGKGVSIPSQLRWIGYVDRWTKHGKIYVERQVEILEVHCWGLRDGVKIQIEGFVNDGKLIKSFHTFTREEREVVRGEVKSTGMAQAVSEVMYKNGLGRSNTKKEDSSVEDDKNSKALKDASTFPLGKGTALDGTSSSKEDYEQSELGTGDVVFRPSSRVVLPTNDINIDIERRNRAAFDLTMVTAVAHVWINAFFEGNGPEQDGVADDSGVFEITWDAMDGIKGSSRKGTQAFEKIAVVWKALKTEEGKPGIVISEPKEGEEVKQTAAADWKGEGYVAPGENKDLGLRTSSPTESNTNISKASSIHSKKGMNEVLTALDRSSQDAATKGVRASGPNGEEIIKEPSSASSGSGPEEQSGTSILPSQVDGTAPLQSKATQETDSVPRVQSPESYSNGIAGIVSGIEHVSTGDLPDGKPESQLKNAKEHTLGHLRKNDTDL